MFRELSQRAIEAFLRRNMSVSEGPARRARPAGPDTPPDPEPPASPVPQQAHRAPYLEDLSDSF